MLFLPVFGVEDVPGEVLEVHRQLGIVCPVLPAQTKGMGIRIQQRELSIKSRVPIAQLHQPVHALYHRALEFLLNIRQGVVMAINILSLLRAVIKIKVVTASKKPHIVYLGNTGSKKLHCPGDKILFVIATQGIVVGTPNLICVKFREVDLGVGFPVQLVDAGICLKHLAFGFQHLLVRHKIPDIHHADPIVRIQGSELLAGAQLHPVFQVEGTAKIDCVENQHRQLEIVGVYVLFL